MRQLGLFEHQDLKEFTKWDSGCEISGEGGTLAKKNFGCGGRPDGMAAEEFRMRFFRMEWRRENFGCDMPDRMLAKENFRMRGTSRCNGGGGIQDEICPGGMATGGIPDAVCPDGMIVVMSSMKDRYGLYGYGGLGEWF